MTISLAYHKVAKSYMRKGFLINEEMRKYFPIYEKAISHLLLCTCSILNFLIYSMRKIFILFFINVLERPKFMLKMSKRTERVAFSLLFWSVVEGDHCNCKLVLIQKGGNRTQK